jgi:hypothetical protein
MKKTLIFLGALVFSTSTIAGHHAPAASPGVLEAWECSYNPGKDLADLMSARDYLVKQADKNNITLEPSFVWSQYKGDAPIDFVWFTAHSNLRAFGAAADRDAASGSSDVQDRFDAVANCTAGMGTVTPVIAPAAPSENNQGVLVSSSSCDLRHGASASDMKDLMRHAGQVLGGMGSNAPSGAYVIEPTTGSNGADRYIFQTHANVTAWTNFIGALSGSPTGQELIRHRNKILDCDNSLWNGQMVVGSMGED